MRARPGGRHGSPYARDAGDAQELARSRTSRRVVVLLADCRATDDEDPDALRALMGGMTGGT